MDNVVYFVSWYVHNKVNDGWAYKVENKYTDKNAAEKAFYTLCGNYIGGETYDIVNVIFNDSTGYIWETKHWQETEEVVEE